MSNLKELKNRIASVRATQKITRAMQMVAASKLRRAQNDLLASRPYISSVADVVKRVAANQPEGGVDVPLYNGNSSNGSGTKRYLLLVLSAQRGLCGSFNSTIARRTAREVETLTAQGCKVTIICAGRKAAEQLGGSGKFDITEIIALPMRGSLTEIAKELAENVSARFARDEFDACRVIYSQFFNVLVQKVRCVTLIPWLDSLNDSEGVEEGGNEAGSRASDSSASPSEDDSGMSALEPESTELLEEVLQRNLVAKITGGLLENAASEQGARMTAMDSASRNAGEMIDDLTLTFNRSRQAIITRELIEIISGAEAV